MTTNLLRPLLTLQQQLARGGVNAPENKPLLEAARREIPAPILAHFLRLAAAGQKGVAVVRHGVCSGCHLRVPDATVHSLMQPTDLHLCENCGAYLMLEQAEPTTPLIVEVPASSRRARRKPAAKLVTM
jgi:hypothetical protein